ncbi:hypothetical protein [Adhaeribacter aquaticus]|uniref:hypothetical protein n=1 Tax=Adhaeribacter aquaticus TaxID=299567 RepID=UPI000479C1B6|nr:hypothetical protein [Adhaeribacter aquaticus]
MNNKLRTTGLAALCSLGIFWSLPAVAQQRSGNWGESNKLEDAEIVVEKNRVNELPEANRNFEKFRISPIERKPQPVAYKFNDFKLADLSLNLPIRVLTIRQEELAKLYGNYVKLGVGNYGTSYVKGYFHNKRDNQYSYGADVSHVSSLRGPVENSGVSNSGINLSGESFSKDLTFGGKLAYSHDRYNFYGYSPLNETIDKEDIKQRFNRIGTGLYFHNNQSGGPFRLSGGLGFDYFSNYYSARESNIKFDLGTTYALDKSSAIKIDADASFINYKDVNSQNRSYFRLKPVYERTTDNLILTLGATVGYTNDTLKTTRSFNLYPNVRVAYELVDDKFQVFAGVGGDLERVSLFRLTQENPFLNQNVAVADVNKVLDFYGGITGSLSSSFQFAGRAAYQSYRNLYFFNNSPVDSAKFDLVYDNGTTKVISFSGDLTYSQSDRFRMGVKAAINQYTTDLLVKPFHRPTFQGNLYSTYNLNDKINIQADLYYISSTFGQVVRNLNSILPTTVLKETDDIVDLNLKADYRFSDKFSTFVMANNILGQSYQRFVNYPNKGFQVIAGISYLF